MLVVCLGAYSEFGMLSFRQTLPFVVFRAQEGPREGRLWVLRVALH